MAGYLEFKRPTLSGNPFEKPLDIETYSFGMKSNGAVGEQINDLQVERNYDKRSVFLAPATARGTRFAEVILTWYRGDAAKEKPLIRFTMMSVLITQYRPSEATPDGRLRDRFVFEWAQSKYEQP